MMKQGIRTCAALGAASVLLMAGAAAAQPVCIAPPNDVPKTGANGAPRWFASDTHGGDVLNWLNDIRWSDAALRPFGSLSNDSAFRAVYEGEHLMVSIQTAGAMGAEEPNVQDRVYFAIGHEGNDKAVAVAINLTGPDGGTKNHPSPITRGAETWIKDDATQICEGGADDGATCAAGNCGDGICRNTWRQITDERAGAGSFPAWLVAPAIWVNEKPLKNCVNDMDANPATNTNGDICNDDDDDSIADAGECGSNGGTCLAIDPTHAVWGSNFKIKMTGTDSVQLPTNAQLKIYVGTRIVDLNPAARTHRRMPLRTASPPAAGEHIFDASSLTEAMVPRDMSLWENTTGLDTPCLGAKLVQSMIGRQVTAGQYDIVDRRVSSNVGDKNVLVATLDCPDGCLPNDFDAKFRVANWGSTPQPRSRPGAFEERGWYPLQDNVGRTEIPLGADKHFTFDCQDNIPGTSTCGVLNEGLDFLRNGYYHQCMAVDISPNTIKQVAVGSEYVNTDFEMASTVQRIATIDVRGMAAEYGNDDDRDIILYVDRTNMPAPTTEELFLPRNEMFADRLDTIGMYSCESSNEAVSCLEIEGPVGVCVYACDAMGDCEEGDTRLPYYYDPDESSCWCTEGDDVLEACYAGDPDQRDPNNDPGVEARLRRSWPTYMVRAYYDTGDKVTKDGVDYMVLDPMTEFGIHIDHIGTHYGFTDSLTGLDGLVVNEIAPDVYRITVKNEERANLLLTVTAEEDPSAVPLTLLSGIVSHFGFFGAIELVGMAPSEGPVDLRYSQVKLDALMKEGSKELVKNLNAPRTLNPLPGALPTVATYINTSGADVVMEVIELPLVGRLTTISATMATVSRPSACSWFGGVADLTTAFSIDDGTNPVWSVESDEAWACIPFAGAINL